MNYVTSKFNYRCIQELETLFSNFFFASVTDIGGILDWIFPK